MSRFDCAERGFDFLIHVETDLGDEVVQALAGKMALHLRKYCFNRVELGAVCNIVDRPDV